MALEVTAQPFIKYRHSSWRGWAVSIATLFKPCWTRNSVRAETHNLTSFPANEIISAVAEVQWSRVRPHCCRLVMECSAARAHHESESTESLDHARVLANESPVRTAYAETEPAAPTMGGEYQIPCENVTGTI